MINMRLGNRDFASTPSILANTGPGRKKRRGGEGRKQDLERIARVWARLEALFSTRSFTHHTSGALPELSRQVASFRLPMNTLFTYFPGRSTFKWTITSSDSFLGRVGRTPLRPPPRLARCGSACTHFRHLKTFVVKFSRSSTTVSTLHGHRISLDSIVTSSPSACEDGNILLLSY